MLVGFVVFLSLNFGLKDSDMSRLDNSFILSFEFVRNLFNFSMEIDAWIDKSEETKGGELGLG